MARKPKESQFWESLKLNDRTYIQYYNRLMELSCSMFEWKNLPDSMDERFLELALFSDGMAVVFEDEVMGLLGLRTMIGGQFDVYNIPTVRTAYASNGYNRRLNQKDSVIVFNNYLHTNSMLDVEMFSRRLYNMDRVIDVNINAQKTPILITCSDSERLTMKNLYKQYDGNEPVIFGNKALDPNSLKILKTDAPYVADRIYELKEKVWGEALTYLGIPNVQYQKKERLISDEVERSMGGTVASRQSRLKTRQQACEKINKMFGTNIWCEYTNFDDLDLNMPNGGDSNE